MADPSPPAALRLLRERCNVPLPPILIRADASPPIGTGHVMRCLALAHAWQAAGGTVLAAAASLTAALEERLRAEGIAVVRLESVAGSPHDADETAALAWQAGAAWVIVDGYGFSGEYQQAIVRAGLPLLVLDDYGHAGHYWAAMVLNQNLDAREALYPSREPAGRLLLGTGYALLRREFWPWQGRPRASRELARRILVTMGGADPGNATLRVIDTLPLLGLPDVEARVVVGGSNPHLAAIRHAVQSAALRLELVENATHMPDLMAWADVAVSAAGTTCWELAFMQLPALLLVLAENQRPNAHELARRGAAVNLGWYADAAPPAIAAALRTLLLDGESRRAMARAGADLVDGRGAQRVAALLQQAAVRVRPAAHDDRARLFGWANDPLTRGMSFHSRPIAWEEHLRWWQRVRGDPHTLLVVGEAWESGTWQPCGQARVDGNGTVSLAVAPPFRGRRLAGPLLRTAVLLARARTPGRPLVAYVKPENVASHRVFVQVGFGDPAPAEVLGQPCTRYLYRRWTMDDGR